MEVTSLNSDSVSWVCVLVFLCGNRKGIWGGGFEGEGEGEGEERETVPLFAFL